MAGGQPPCTSNSIPKSGRLLGVPSSTDSCKAVPLLRPQSELSLPKPYHYLNGLNARTFSRLRFTARKSRLTYIVPTRGILQIPASFHGFQHGYFVGILQISAYGNPDSDAGHSDAERLQKLRKVNCRRLALRRWIRRNNNLFDRDALQPLNERLDMKLFRPASRKRRKRPAQHVIHAAVGARFLDC